MNIASRPSFKIGLGVISGALAYYLLSLISALWIGRVNEPPPYAALLGICLVGCIALGWLVSWRWESALLASIVMILLIAVGFVVGSDGYLWVLPLPFDVPSLFLHGARSPITFSVAVLVGTVAIFRRTPKRPDDGVGSGRMQNRSTSRIEQQGDQRLRS